MSDEPRKKRERARGEVPPAGAAPADPTFGLPQERLASANTLLGAALKMREAEERTGGPVRLPSGTDPTLEAQIPPVAVDAPPAAAETALASTLPALAPPPPPPRALRDEPTLDDTRGAGPDATLDEQALFERAALRLPGPVTLDGSLPGGAGTQSSLDATRADEDPFLAPHGAAHRDKRSPGEPPPQAPSAHAAPVWQSSPTLPGVPIAAVAPPPIERPAVTLDGSIARVPTLQALPGAVQGTGSEPTTAPMPVVAPVPIAAPRTVDESITTGAAAPRPNERRMAPALALLIGLAAPLGLLAWQLWRMRAATSGDALALVHHAQALARGGGANAGEAGAGPTSLVWTLLAAAGGAAGADALVVAKIASAACAGLCLVAAYFLERRLRGITRVPPLAPWLLASSLVFAANGASGLETMLCATLGTFGALLLWREVERGRGMPWSALVLGAATLVRPEALLFTLVPSAFLGRRALAPASLARIGASVVAAGAAAGLRYALFGAWLGAGTFAWHGAFGAQLAAGARDVALYLALGGPLAWLALYGLGEGIAARRRDLGATFALTAVWLVYVVVAATGGLAPLRGFAPIEPFVAVLVGAGLRAGLESSSRALRIALVAFVALSVGYRVAVAWNWNSPVEAAERTASG